MFPQVTFAEKLFGFLPPSLQIFVVVTSGHVPEADIQAAFK